MYSNVDHGAGGGTGLADYPYFVENINGTTNPYPDTYSTSRTYSQAGNYLAELALSGYGVQDQCAYTIGGSPPPSGGTPPITGNCNPACNPDTQMCLFGKCYEKQQVMMVGAAALLLMMLK
jgi:hypothetical protein